MIRKNNTDYNQPLGGKLVLDKFEENFPQFENKNKKQEGEWIKWASDTLFSGHQNFRINNLSV